MIDEKCPMTKSQVNALTWLRQHNGEGCFDKHGVLLAAGETAPFRRVTWNTLRAAGFIEYYGKRRVRMIDNRGNIHD